MTAVLKWDVQVNGLEQFVGSGPVVMVASQYDNDRVQVWTLESDDVGLRRRDRAVVVYGTGHVVPAGLRHIGSTLAAPFVWHVFEAVPPVPVGSPGKEAGE